MANETGRGRLNVKTVPAGWPMPACHSAYCDSTAAYRAKHSTSALPPTLLPPLHVGHVWCPGSEQLLKLCSINDGKALAVHLVPQASRVDSSSRGLSWALVLLSCWRLGTWPPLTKAACCSAACCRATRRPAQVDGQPVAAVQTCSPQVTDKVCVAGGC